MPNTLHVDYELRSHDDAQKIVDKALQTAREQIPKGAVADYIPELGLASYNTVSLNTETILSPAGCNACRISDS